MKHLCYATLLHVHVNCVYTLSHWQKAHHHRWACSRVSAFRQTRRDKWRCVTGLSCCVMGCLPMPFIHSHIFCDAASQLDSTPPVTSALWVPERQSANSSLKPTPPKCQSNPINGSKPEWQRKWKRASKKGLNLGPRLWPWTQSLFGVIWFVFEYGYWCFSCLWWKVSI